MKPASAQTSLFFACRIDMPARTGRWKRFRFERARLAVRATHFDINGCRIAKDQVREVSQRRGKVRIVTSDKTLEFTIVNPLGYGPDAAHAFMVAEMLRALCTGDTHRAQVVGDRLKFIFRLYWLVVAAVVFILLGQSVVFYLFPSILKEVGVASVIFCLVLVVFTGSWAKRIQRQLRPPRE